MAPTDSRLVSRILLPLLPSAVILVSTMNCGGSDSSPPARAGESPTLVPLGNFNMSCGKNSSGNPSAQQQVQAEFQQQQYPGCTPQFVFTGSKLSDWDVQVDCERQEVIVLSKGRDRRQAVLPIGPDGGIKGAMSYQQQIQSDSKGTVVCWVEYEVRFDGRASCAPGVVPRGISLSTEVSFGRSSPGQIPRSSSDDDYALTAGELRTQPSDGSSEGPTEAPIPLPEPSPDEPLPIRTVRLPSPPQPELTPAGDYLPSPSPSASPSPSHSPSPSPSPSVRPTYIPVPRPIHTLRPLPTRTVRIQPIQVCIVEQPCPVVGKVDYSCPSEQSEGGAGSTPIPGY